MFYRKEEGEKFRCGFNYSKTSGGNGFWLMICLPKTDKILLGYYWGQKFNLMFNVWNQAEEDEKERHFTRADV